MQTGGRLVDLGARRSCVTKTEVMCSGIEQVGTPLEIYQEPATSFAYRFIGAVNQFRGRYYHGSVHIGEDVIPIGSNGLADGAEIVSTRLKVFADDTRKAA